jgi:signal transduction histidine kinase
MRRERRYFTRAGCKPAQGRRSIMVVERERSAAAGMAPSDAITAADGDRVGRRMDGLIGMLSHDLRTPLSAISGWLFLLESGKLDAEGQKRALAKIRSSVEEQVRLIDDTLAISRGATGRLEVEAAQFDVSEVLAAAVATAKPAAAARGIAVDSDPLAAPSLVVGDRARLQRALDLLLAHAIKATLPHGKISVAGRARPDALVIDIVDGGPGMTADDLRWLLDPFGRPPDEHGGHAVRGVERGLLLAHALIAAQGGRLEVASEGPGHGAVFTVVLREDAVDGRAAGSAG